MFKFLSIKKHWKKKHKNKSDAYPKFSQRYDRPHCATLKVPCRFVSDHACCRFKVCLFQNHSRSYHVKISGFKALSIYFYFHSLRCH